METTTVEKEEKDARASAHKEIATVREMTEIGRLTHIRTEGEPYCESHSTHQKPK